MSVTERSHWPPAETEGSVVVQDSAELQITGITTSRDTVTEGQAAPWTVSAVVMVVLEFRYFFTARARRTQRKILHFFLYVLPGEIDCHAEITCW